MEFRKLINSVSLAVVAQGLSSLVSIVATLLLPKVLGIGEYGYYQLFIFYGTYVGLFHLGLNDGVYLVNGGIRRDQIDKRSIISQFFVGLSYELVFCAAIVFSALQSTLLYPRQFVLVTVGIYMLLKCASAYLGYVLQAINETRTYSKSVLLEKVTFLLLLVLLLLQHVSQFEPFVVSMLVGATVSLTYCIWSTRDFFISILLPIKSALRATLQSISIGIRLLLANLAGQLIIGISRFYMDYHWGIEVFSGVSLALSIVAFILPFISQVSMVLFPALRQKDNSHLGSFFVISRDLLSFTLPALFILYYPLSMLLTAWLPTYHQSFVLLGLLMPLCIFEGKNDITCSTLLKVLRKERLLLIINIITVGVSALLAALGTFVANSVNLTLVAVVVAVAVRNIGTELYLDHIFEVNGKRLAVAEILLTVTYVLSLNLLPTMRSFILVLIAYIVFLFLFRSRLYSSFGRLVHLIRAEY